MPASGGGLNRADCGALPYRMGLEPELLLRSRDDESMGSLGFLGIGI